MHIKTKVDYIIVGQGLAGSCLALDLINRGKRLVVIDEPSENHSSTVAAGLFNPITGKFLKKSWMAEKLFPALFQFYGEAEKQLNQKFLHSIPIYRPFESIEEQNNWMGKSESPTVKTFVKEIHTSAQWPHQVHNPFGGLLIQQCGYLNVNQFMKAVRDFLTANDSFLQGKIRFEELKITDTSVEYGNWEAEKIIFCEGTAVAHNPYFHWVPLRPMKGEVLVIDLLTDPEVIYNRGVYIVPDQGARHNVGATYQQPPFENEITDAGRAELVSKLNDLVALPYNVVGQKWGIRPTSPDRRPMLGAHPVHKNAVIFNALGTKGVSLAPYFATHLAHWLTHPAEIIKEVNIQRFYPLYSGSSL
jgi:glycine/D-amino acid oxidase-like deaminating enzyme